MRVIKLSVVVVLLLAVLGAGIAQGDSPTLTKPTITSGPASWTQETTASFAFVNQDPTPDVSLQCRFDGGAWELCASPLGPVSVAEGPHTFDARAITGDPENPDERSTPAEWAWTVDLTPPSLPGNKSAEATSPLGAVVSFAAADNLDPAPQLACDAISGSVFSLGSTNVNCTADDAAGNHADGSFKVTVADTTAPVLAPPENVIVPQHSASGATVNYDSPAVSDAGDANPIVTCAPQPGLFAIGSTTVTCSATDASGNTGNSVHFDVIVEKGAIPPAPEVTADVGRLTNRTSVHLTFDVGALSAECELEGPGAPVGPKPCATSATYTNLEDGDYLFTLRVTNSIGNINETTRAWRVDTTPPARVGAFRTHSGDGWVKLFWTKPIDVGYSHVVIRRKRVGATDWKNIGTRRKASSLVDWKARNDVRYTYAIRSVDKAGNPSPAATAQGRASKILSPQYAAVVDPPLHIDWAPVQDASYFNMQVWRRGTKILSVWPLRSAFRLRGSWTFNGRHYSLTSDRLSVYVWPGYGPKLKAKYGSLLGWTAFSTR